jgi:DNA-binding transcriptional regulator LsrR (DeoR family)
MAKSLRASPSIAETLRMAARADQLLIGIGSPYLPNAGLRRAGYLTDADLAALERCGAVGDIAGYHVNASGEVLTSRLTAASSVCIQTPWARSPTSLSWRPAALRWPRSPQRCAASTSIR